MSPRRRKESRGYVRQTVRENFLFSKNKTILIQVSKKIWEKWKKNLEKIILGENNFNRTRPDPWRVEQIFINFFIKKN